MKACWFCWPDLSPNMQRVKVYYNKCREVEKERSINMVTTHLFAKISYKIVEL